MSEELTGKEFVEASHGISPAPIAPETPEPEQYGGGFEELKRAANDHTAERGSSETEPVERFLEWKTGSKAGQRVDLAKEGFSLTPETAAKTLSEVHRTEDAMEANTNLANLANEVDLARSQLAGQQPQPDAPVADTTPAQPDASQPQPEAGEQPSGIHPKIAAVLADPEARMLIEQPLQQAEAARQQYVGATQQIAGMLVAELAADLPEIVSLPPEQRLVGLQILQKQQPERYAAVEAKAGRIQAVVNAQQQNAAVEAAQRQQQFTQYALQQDAAFDNANRNESPETLRAAAKEIVDFANSSGISHEGMAQLWATNPVLRAAPFQQLLLDAAKFRMAQRTATANPASRGNIPPVQRPGIAPSPGERAVGDLTELRNQFRNSSGNDQIRAAVKLQQAQRRARG